MAKMDWEKAARRDRVEKPQLVVNHKTPMITNKQAKRLASLQRAAHTAYSGHGMTRREAAKAIGRLEARLGLAPGRPVQAAKKPKPSGTETDVWWWTVVKFDGRCSECSERLPKGLTVAYNHFLRQALCEVCCDRAGHAPKMSHAARALRKDAA